MECADESWWVDASERGYAGNAGYVGASNGSMDSFGTNRSAGGDGTAYAHLPPRNAPFVQVRTIVVALNFFSCLFLSCLVFLVLVLSLFLVFFLSFS